MAAAPAADAVRVKPAATVIVVDDRPELHVLLLRRRQGSAFVGGMDVFPGGGVDPHDAAPEVEAVCAGLDDATASARLGVEAGGLAYWVAAVRETFEEAGVLLARRAADGLPLDPAEPGVAERLAAERRAVDRGELRLADAVRAAGLQLAVDAMHYAARWITPPGPPRRYDTRFFVAALPAGQKAAADRREAVGSAWVRPAEALAQFRSGERVMLPPTVGMLQILAGYGSSQELVAAARRDACGPDRPVRLAGADGRWSVLLPGESLRDAPAGTRIQEMQAWVRLCARAAEA